ncbi:UBP-type zinc finger domain-containing protein [Streptomyces sp. NPDC002309]
MGSWVVRRDGGRPEGRSCRHVGTLRQAPAPRGAVCPECVSRGLDWVHLRQCLSCGRVGCCDSSPGKHAAAHFESSRHPVMRSVEPGESWAWCCVDEVYLDPLGPDPLGPDV